MHLRCVRSLVLFTLHTNECTCSTANNHKIEFYNDTAILGLMSNTSDTAVNKHEIQKLVEVCDTLPHPQCKKKRGDYQPQTHLRPPLGYPRAEHNTSSHRPKRIFQTPAISFTLNTSFFPQADASESPSAIALRTPLSHCPLKP